MALSVAEHPISDARAVADVEKYLDQYRRDNINWHTILNNTTTTRPNMYGGSVVKSLRHHTDYEKLSEDHWICELKLPMLNDFKLPMSAKTAAATKVRAEHLACREVFARLLLANPEWVVLRTCHWHVPVQQLIDDMPHGGEKHQALPVHIRAPFGDPAAAAQGLTEDEVDVRVGGILRKILESHNGRFDPSAIDHKAAGLGAHDEPLYKQLHSLIHRGQLREVIDRLPGISWHPRDLNSKSPGMIVTWSPGSGCRSRESACDGSAFEVPAFGNAASSIGPQASSPSPKPTIVIAASSEVESRSTCSQRLRETLEDSSGFVSSEQIHITVSVSGLANTMPADADTQFDWSALD